jgi:hypothetical protein
MVTHHNPAKREESDQGGPQKYKLSLELKTGLRNPPIKKKKKKKKKMMMMYNVINHRNHHVLV